MKIGRKTKSILSFEHIGKTAPVLSIHAQGSVRDEDKNQQAEGGSEKPFSERPFQQRGAGTFLPVHRKVGQSGFFPFLLQDFYYRHLAWRQSASARCNNLSISLGFCTLSGGFSVTSAAVPG